MIDGARQEIEDDCEAEWAQRCHHWIEKGQMPIRPRGRRERNCEALILSGHGASLRVDSGTLLVRDGFTHYPQRQKIHRFFPGDLARPSRIILLDGSGNITFDALSWLAEQGVPLVRVTWRGDATCVVVGTGLATDRKKIEWQKQTRSDPLRRQVYCRDLICRKLAASIETLRQCVPDTARRRTAIDTATHAISDFREGKQEYEMPKLLGIEGVCAIAYFAAWSALELNWVGTSRRPIPDDWRRFTSRSSLATIRRTNANKRENVNASHPINAMLNYAYAVLKSQVQIQAMAEGYDPTAGIMHNTHRGTAAFVFDLMEPERPIVDRAVLKFVQSKKLHPVDFVLREDGVCRLNPEMARVVAAAIHEALKREAMALPMLGNRQSWPGSLPLG
jgi:CRISPR/Cas system-associated endonuclease Cas1